MDFLMIILRLIHIFAGVFWVGTSFFMVSFVQPAVVATGDVGQKFMQQLGLRSKLSEAMAGTGILTFLSGLIMYGIISGFRSGWILSGYGLFLTVGGIAGTIGLITGFLLQRNPIKEMRAIAVQIQSGGGPPDPTLIANMQALAGKLARGGIITSIILAIALFGMSIAQYVSF